jgi:hypothetical protein
MTKSMEDKHKIYSFGNYYDFKNCIFYQMGRSLLECFKNHKGIAVFQYFKILQHFKTSPPTFSPIHTNCIISMGQGLKTFKSHDL